MKTKHTWFLCYSISYDKSRDEISIPLTNDVS